MGGIYGCGCKDVYRFPHITYPYSSCIYLIFFAASLLLFIKKKSFCCFCSNNFCNLCKNFFTQYKHSLASHTYFPQRNSLDNFASRVRVAHSAVTLNWA